MTEQLTPTIGPMTKMAITDLQFQFDSKRYNYTPKEDVTNYELAVLIKLVAFGVVASRQPVPYDWSTYIKQHKLERHFTEV